jgi:hypothetical protein
MKAVSAPTIEFWSLPRPRGTRKAGMDRNALLSPTARRRVLVWLSCLGCLLFAAAGTYAAIHADEPGELLMAFLAVVTFLACGFIIDWTSSSDRPKR